MLCSLVVESTCLTSKGPLVRISPREQSNKMKKLIPIGNYLLRDGRMFFAIDLEQNNLPLLRKGFTKELMNKDVEITGRWYTVRGIEAFATAESYEHRTIGIMVIENVPLVKDAP